MQKSNIMADISMCYNDTCPLRETCYRFTAKPNPWRQTYADFTWSEDNEGKITCGDYWNNTEYLKDDKL